MAENKEFRRRADETRLRNLAAKKAERQKLNPREEKELKRLQAALKADQ